MKVYIQKKVINFLYCVFEEAENVKTNALIDKNKYLSMYVWILYLFAGASFCQ